MSFREQLIEILDGFTPANPLRVSPSAYVEFSAMPEIADLLPRLATDERVIAMCRGKEAFGDPQTANKALRRIQQAGKRARKNLGNDYGAREAYRCPACNRWHIGRRSR